MKDWSLNSKDIEPFKNPDEFTLKELLRLAAEGNKSLSITIKDDNGNTIYHLNN
jgi:hypothetical protein